MRTLKFLLQKEFRQIFRNPAILRIIFIMPVMQLLILPLAADYEMKDIKLSVVDLDHSSYSRQLVSKITASGYFKLTGFSASYKGAMNDIEEDRSDLILTIPFRFEKDLVRDSENTLFMSVNAINGVKANLGGAYMGMIIQDFNRDVRLKWLEFPRMNPEPLVEVTYSHWFNPLMSYKHFMVPGILVVLITMVGSFLATLNIVKEKEIGTIEQINVTPIKRHYFILGKLIPFWVLGILILTVGLFIARVIYGIIPAGHFYVIYVFAAVYLLAILGLGLLISNYSSNQQQAMLISFFLMMVLILLSGIYTSIDSMPNWAIWFTRLNPVTYFVEVMRMVILKGSGLEDISRHIFTMLGFGLLLNGWAILSYHKRS
jgi:ABC-2 type transport system permease protein